MSQAEFFRDGDVLNRLVADLHAVPPAALEHPARWREAAQRVPRAARRSSRSRVAWAAATAMVGSGLAVVVGLGVPGTERASALPVLDVETVDASGLRENAKLLDRAKANFDEAHAIDTPYGTGYVMTGADGKVCLAVPDMPGAGYGQACAQRERVEARGLHLTLISTQRAVAVAIVPAGTRDATLRTGDGAEQSLVIRDGVVAVSTKDGDVMTYRTKQHAVRVPLRRHAKCFLLPTGATAAKRQFLETAIGLPPCPSSAGAGE